MYIEPRIDPFPGFSFPSIWPDSLHQKFQFIHRRLQIVSEYANVCSFDTWSSQMELQILLVVTGVLFE